MFPLSKTRPNTLAESEPQQEDSEDFTDSDNDEVDESIGPPAGHPSTPSTAPAAPQATVSPSTPREAGSTVPLTVTIPKSTIPPIVPPDQTAVVPSNPVIGASPPSLLQAVVMVDLKFKGLVAMTVAVRMDLAVRLLDFAFIDEFKHNASALNKAIMQGMKPKKSHLSIVDGVLSFTPEVESDASSVEELHQCHLAWYNLLIPHHPITMMPLVWSLIEKIHHIGLRRGLIAMRTVSYHSRMQNALRPTLEERRANVGVISQEHYVECMLMPSTAPASKSSTTSSVASSTSTSKKVSKKARTRPKSATIQGGAPDGRPRCALVDTLEGCSTGARSCPNRHSCRTKSCSINRKGATHSCGQVLRQSGGAHSSESKRSSPSQPGK
jgi:hypothetical protein